MSNDPATAFVTGLAERGVGVTLRGNKIILTPAVAYKTLSDVEYLALRNHRESIKQVIREGVQYAATTAQSASQTTPATSPSCTFCGGRTCVRRNHPHFAMLHWRDPEEVARRAQEQTDVMMKMIRFGRY